MLKDSLSAERIKETQYTGGRIAISSCGTYLFCIQGSSVNIIDINSGVCVFTLESEEEEVTCVVISPDDKHVVTAHRNLLLKQWDNWKNWENATPNETVSQEDSGKGKSISKCTRTWKAIHTAPVQFMCFDVTSTLLATGSSDHTTKVWDIQAQYCTHNLKGSQGVITCCQFHPLIEKIQTCLTASEDGKIRLYNLNTSRMDGCMEGHFSSVTSVEFINLASDSNDSNFNYAMSTSRDKVLIIWDLKTFAKVKTIPVYESVESCLMLSRLFATRDFDGYTLTMGNDGLIKLWDLQNSKMLVSQSDLDSPKIVNRSNEAASSLEQCFIQSVFIKSKNMLCLVTIDQLIIFVQLDPDQLGGFIKGLSTKQEHSQELFQTSKQFIGDHGEILDAQLLNANANLLALATNSEFIKIYDLDTWNCMLLKGHKDLVIGLSAYDGKLKSADDTKKIDYFASSSKDSTIKLWRVTRNSEGSIQRECVADGKGHTQDIGALAFSHCSFDFLVSGSMDTTIKLWKIIEKEDSISLRVQFTMKAHEKDINSVCVSPNDKLIASGSSDKTAKLWSSEDGSCLAVLRGHKRGIWCVNFSSVDQLIATSSADATIKLWSLADFSCVKTFEGHNTSILKVHFMNNGTQLISSASDGLIKLWNIKTSECVGTFDKHDDKAWALCVSKDEKRVLSGAADGRLVVWRDVTEEKREELIEQRQEIVLKEQELSNFLKEKKWKKALGLAILLDKPFNCYQIIKEILQQTSEVLDADGARTTKGRLDLETTLLKLRDDQIKSLLRYAINWNTNTKFCHLAQVVFEVVFRNYPPEFLLNNSDANEFGAKLIEQFLPYTERHNVRLNKLAQQIMFIDFTWSNMKLTDES